MKKGQAAMEFLMTYGWAILVVIAAIAALAYFGVLDPAQLLPDRCQFPAGMDCIGKASIDGAADTVTFALRNNIGFDIDANNANLPTPDTGLCLQYQLLSVDAAVPAWSIAANVGTALGAGFEVTVKNNDRLQVRLLGCNMDSGDKYQGTISVSYVDSNTGLDQKALGEVRGRVA